MISQRQLFLSHLAQTSPAPLGLEIDHAEGIYLYDIDGKRYSDLISGTSVSNIGHRHPKVIQAIHNQLDKYLHLAVYGEYIQSPQVLLAEALCKMLPDQLQSIYLLNSGSEAVEGALKLAKRYTGRSEIFSFYNAYHGSSHGSLSVMGSEIFKNAFRPLLPGIRFLNFNKTGEINQITQKTACVIIEPVQGEAGVCPATEDYLKALRQRCTETGTLLIFDEVQTGFGRTGSLFAFMQYGVIPDILVLAKGIGGGMPLGAFISSVEIMKSLSENPILGHITTFGGHPVCCAAAIANLQVIKEEKLTEKVHEKELHFRKRLEKHSAIQEIRSSGLLMALQMDSFAHVQQMIDYCLEDGIILEWFLFCDSAFRISPPLTISDQQIEESCDIILKNLDKI